MKIHSISLQGLKQQVSKMADTSNIDAPKYSSSSFTPSEKLELSVSKLVYFFQIFRIFFCDIFREFPERYLGDCTLYLWKS